jgi:hypothetical protein
LLPRLKPKESGRKKRKLQNKQKNKDLLMKLKPNALSKRRRKQKDLEWKRKKN